MLQLVRTVAAAHKLSVHNLILSEQSGGLLVFLHVEASPDMTLREAHEYVVMFEKALGKRLNTTRIETHIEPEDRLCAPENALPDGYVKPDYQLADNDLEYYRDKKPTSADLSREAAAELGVQGLYRVFGLDMNGKTIEMAYNPAQNGHRATWEGNWWPDGKKKQLRGICAGLLFQPGCRNRRTVQRHT